MKILSWNIRQGGGKRITPICSYLRSSGAHVVVLSEFRNNAAGLSLRKRMLDYNYLHQATHAGDATTNGVAVFAKVPFETSCYHRHFEFGRGLIRCDFGPLQLAACYLPHKKKHHLFKALLDMAAEDAHLVIAGDLNTGHNYIDQKGDSFWYTDELNKLENLGMTDSFRHLNGPVAEYSWFSHGGNGFRYDHTYTSAALLPIVKSCYYDHSVREDGLSDHSAMIVVLAKSE